MTTAADITAQRKYAAKLRREADGYADNGNAGLARVFGDMADRAHEWYLELVAENPAAAAESHEDARERTHFIPPDTESYVVTARFYEDHCGRTDGADLYERVTRTTKSGTVTVMLTADEAADLLSDAEHYASEGTATFGPEYLGLVSSARATARRLRKAGVGR